MKAKLFVALLPGLLAGVAAAQPTRPDLPVYQKPDVLADACAAAVEKARAMADRIRTVPVEAVTTGNVLAAWDRINVVLENEIGPAYLQAYVHPEATVRAAGEDCILAYRRLETELFQDPALHRRVAAVVVDGPVDRKLKRDLLEAFEDTGAALPPEKRDRARTLLARIEELGQRFQRNLRNNDDTLRFPPSQQRGLPESYLQWVTKHENGDIEVGFDYPEYFPFMANAEDGQARERYYRAFANRGGADNIAILRELTALRRELASLYDLPSYAHFTIRRRMAGSPERVQTFLNRVDAAVTPLARKQVAALAALKAQDSGDEQANLQPWDKRYYLERLRRRRYDVDQEALRRYFPMPEMIDWVLALAADLYGLRFIPAEVPAWHESVRYYDVRDADGGAFIGGLYLDLYPREGKYGHAAAFSVYGASTRAGRRPVSALVANFNRDGLTLKELETYLHEIGHALHNLLSTTHYSRHSGTEVSLDFVEAPSQMFEEWARSPATLARIRDVCDRCPALDRSLIERLDAARRLDRPLFYRRQLLYARYDLALASPEPPGDPLAAWAEMEKHTPLGHAPGTAFPGSFGHIAGGYAAGYYGYMWSESLALDMVGAWNGKLMDPAVGRRFRERILAHGGELPAMRLVRDFLGRTPQPDAFFAEIRGERK